MIMITGMIMIGIGCGIFKGGGWITEKERAVIIEILSIIYSLVV